MKDLFKKYNKAFNKANDLTKQFIQKLYEEQIQIYIGYKFGCEGAYGLLESVDYDKWVVKLTKNPNNWMFFYIQDIVAIDEYEGSYFIQLH